MGLMIVFHSFRVVMYFLDFFFFFSSRRRHTRCALVTGVQTCALPISSPAGGRPAVAWPTEIGRLPPRWMRLRSAALRICVAILSTARSREIGRASCRERVCQYV